ncbi:MAG: hypothetical protein ACF8Q5_03280 [Phycisphaerales bacterium JB040]
MVPERVASRRGLAVLVLVVVVALFSLVVLSVGNAGADDVSRLRLREESSHALLAAQSAGEILLARAESGTPITPGDVLVTHASGQGVVVEADGGEGRYVVEGRSGRAVRRVELRLGP